MEADGIHTRIEGEGSPTLILVHGFGCAQEDWNAVLPLLAGNHRCVTLDLPGHGRSAPSEPTIARLAQSVNAVRRRHAECRTVLVGHSLGAKIIREAYLQDPAGIAGLVLIDGAFYQGDCDALAEKMRMQIAELGFRAFAIEHFSRMFDARFPARLRETMLARVAAQDPDFARPLYLDAIRFDAKRSLETLAAITAPILVLQSTAVALPHGRQSLREGAVTPLMRAVCEQTPHGTARIVPDCGHFTMIDAPDSVASEIEAFVAGLI